jgi:DNA-binding MurR/RpiR family transcriptional regulator
VPAAEEQRLLDSTRQSIGDVTKVVAELEARPLKPPQQETLKTAKNFLDQARSALDQRDYQRAANLASKARALTDDLAGAAK